MYTPAHFLPDNTQAALDLVRAHPLGALVHWHAGGLDANHIPWALEVPDVLAQKPAGAFSDALLDTAPGAESGDLPQPLRLIGHIARANPLCTQLADGAQVLVVFQAEQGYISPNWYPSKHVTHQLVPTWNYRVVHMHGTVRLHDDKKWVLGAVGKLTRTHEQRTQDVLPDAAGAWKIKDAPADYMDTMLAAIVGIEVTVTRMQAKFKLSQNRSAQDLAHAAAQVDAAGNAALGAAMAEVLQPR